ncbi:hypothetical protein LAZ67_16000144 [Cordylochernes scorpioides]|uniref:Uncharacterized protein n=1 Tax=Cordylochernes scorpioides TaxID=51811 RepID=A0ABY6LEI9_9ARAC|nr:hypothetical protein LAZ67_16000144 [Cordylochernes scorpioides]
MLAKIEGRPAMSWLEGIKEIYLKVTRWATSFIHGNYGATTIVWRTSAQDDGDKGVGQSIRSSVPKDEHGYMALLTGKPPF